jgi:urease accessory protein
VSDEAALEAFRLADSFLPIGTFTASYGLEQFVADGRVADGADLEALLSSYLRRIVGPGDLVALRAAYTATEDEDLDALCTADRRLHATTLAAELRESACRAGERLLRLQCDVGDDPFLEAYAERVRRSESGDTPGTYAAVFGACTARRRVPVRRSALVYCHTFVTGLIGAAQRLVSLGHTEAQRALIALRPAMITATEDSADRSLDEMTPFAPLVDVLAAEHERADRRLFVS